MDSLFRRWEDIENPNIFKSGYRVCLNGPVVKNLPVYAGDSTDVNSIPGSGRFPWRKKWQSTPVFLPGKPQGQWSLTGYSPWGRKLRYYLATEQQHRSVQLWEGVENGKTVNKNLAKGEGTIHLHSLWWKELVQRETAASLCKVLKLQLQTDN